MITIKNKKKTLEGTVEEISDKFFSESKARNLIQKGTSINKIRNYLISKGIQGNDIKDTINKINENNKDQDFFSAIKICKKKKNRAF